MTSRRHTRRRTQRVPGRAGTKSAGFEQPRKRGVMLLNDHPMTRESLATIISRQPDLAVCFEAGNPAEAMTLLSKPQPDLTMPGHTRP